MINVTNTQNILENEYKETKTKGRQFVPDSSTPTQATRLLGVDLYSQFHVHKVQAKLELTSQKTPVRTDNKKQARIIAVVKLKTYPKTTILSYFQVFYERDKRGWFNKGVLPKSNKQQVSSLQSYLNFFTHFNYLFLCLAVQILFAPQTIFTK